ncbi:MAG: hemolysin III family protein [Bdellovibrionales bacterium]|nr:hemolysin III family protein [Bdellovibrionales bacterium]
MLLRFDFAGISLLIAGSAFPTFYYSLYCHFAVA